jgi:hypothetical protein
MSSSGLGGGKKVRMKRRRRRSMELDWILISLMME